MLKIAIILYPHLRSRCLNLIYELIGRNFQRTPDEDESRAASSVIGCWCWCWFLCDLVPVDEAAVVELGLALALFVLSIPAADVCDAVEVMEAGTEAADDAVDDMTTFPFLMSQCIANVWLDMKMSEQAGGRDEGSMRR
jgi:hypothetical protein